MFNTTFSSLAWICVFALVSVGSLQSCGILNPGPPTTVQGKADLAALEIEGGEVAAELDEARASGDVGRIAAAQAHEEDLNRRWAEFEANAVRTKLGPIGALVGSIHPALIPLAAFGVNMAAGLAGKRGRKHAWNAVKNFAPWKNGDGTEFRPIEGLKDIARMNGWIHSNKASEAAANGSAPAPPA